MAVDWKSYLAVAHRAAECPGIPEVPGDHAAGCRAVRVDAVEDLVLHNRLIEPGSVLTRSPPRWRASR